MVAAAGWLPAEGAVTATGISVKSGSIAFGDLGMVAVDSGPCRTSPLRSWPRGRPRTGSIRAPWRPPLTGWIAGLGDSAAADVSDSTAAASSADRAKFSGSSSTRRDCSQARHSAATLRNRTMIARPATAPLVLRRLTRTTSDLEEGGCSGDCSSSPSPAGATRVREVLA